MSSEQDQDQAFLKSFGIVMLILAVIAVSSFFGARWISAIAEPHVPRPEQKLLAQQRTDPVYRVITDAGALQKVAANGGAAQAGPAKSGEEVFKAVCHTCHVPGLLGAPKVTDTAEWKKRLAEQGLETLHHSAIHGLGKMPPKGGKASLSDDEVIAAVNYILATAGVETAAAATSDKAEAGADKKAEGEAAAPEKDTTAAADKAQDKSAASGKAENTNKAESGADKKAKNEAAASRKDATAAADKAQEKSTASDEAKNTNEAEGGGDKAAAGATTASSGAAAIDAQTANTVGKKVFKALCHTCHVPGIAGAPKVSDGAEWKKRLAAQGLDKLHYNAIHGLGAMPPKGGDATLSDDEVIAAVNYMLLKSGAK